MKPDRMRPGGWVAERWRYKAAQRPRQVPLPVYRPSIVATCPECCGDLQHEGGNDYWCPACQKSFYFTEVVLFEDGDRDD